MVPVGELGGDELKAFSADGMLMLSGLMLLDLTGVLGSSTLSRSEVSIKEVNCKRMLVLGNRM